ncbi:succinate dehydrogenase and fumarate reductase iron-sulfur protein [Bacteriovorax sp. BSW11_IV]|uniref:succinate dehydrogenase/fumarate reductase iron-sulfur subunit n=1 Tax=Bacteriovorax sp. BSW11_IV TaxID=1353529 RepID=UPI00038A47A0|nr:succinate dehydrogenase/fumarate reductase iron-sulfur subunit [Bacteriovorax sp. BSW11_IV]EQC49412.1 succinate dehydrogenase and fumarate reductase iron-sulfur protein [Bacteriovorax sp. BSW11_IV]
MRVNFKIWRQESHQEEGSFKDYSVDNITSDMSLLEALDYLNETLVLKDEKVVAFDYDCREGICGQCGIFVNGRAHGPHDNTTTCQVHMRSFEDGQTIVLEPWRARAFPIVKDLIVDRSALDRIIQKNGYITVKTGGAGEANSILVAKKDADKAMDAAACIGCGACIATCKNSSASLFTAAKINHLDHLPQGKLETNERVMAMVSQMELENFGSCSFTGACEIECPQSISITEIARMNNLFLKAKLTKE